VAETDTGGGVDADGNLHGHLENSGA
jgi:hypothetical protein